MRIRTRAVEAKYHLLGTFMFNKNSCTSAFRKRWISDCWCSHSICTLNGRMLDYITDFQLQRLSIYTSGWLVPKWNFIAGSRDVYFRFLHGLYAKNQWTNEPGTLKLVRFDAASFSCQIIFNAEARGIEHTLHWLATPGVEIL